MLALSKGQSRVGVFQSSLKTEIGPVSKMSFPSYLEFQMMDEVHKPSDSECNKLSWEKAGY
jgi:hypothetical protein